MTIPRVRIAPSPTGSTHVGLVRSSLFNQLFARHHKGTFILRIEDTDEARSTAESEKTIMNDLKWCNICWDEGPDIGGPHAPYRQSERTEIYRQWADRLVQSGHAYYCFCTDEELEKKKQSAMETSGNPQYDGTCREIPPAEARTRIANGEKAAIRFRVPDHEIRFSDLVRGDLCFEPGVVGDFIILRSNGMPIYNFAVVIDDITMEITHVFRGEEHLSNTPRQIMIYQALGCTPPVFGHLSLLLGEDRQKLSKRHGATSVSELRNQGFLPEALVNYLFLLGWSPKSDEEFFRYDQMVELFNTENLIPSPQVFDMKKLASINHHYISQLPDKELLYKIHQFLPADATRDDDPDFPLKLVTACKSSLNTLSDLKHRSHYFTSDDFTYTSDLSEIPAEKTELLFDNFLKSLLKHGIADKILMNQQLKECGKTLGLKGSELFHPVRIAMTGSEEGPGIYDIIQCIGLVRTEKRMKNFIAALKR